MSAEEVLLWGYETFGEKLCLTCSWQKQSSVLVHMVSELGLDVPVIELDTGLFFAETYETREKLVQGYGPGPTPWARAPRLCSRGRKLEPLGRGLSVYDSWISGGSTLRTWQQRSGSRSQ